jgi:hypothetical protein
MVTPLVLKAKFSSLSEHTNYYFYTKFIRSSTIVDGKTAESTKLIFKKKI